MANLCIIPARGGSKRIPRKNIKDFLGKPIIAYSIEAALQSGLFEEVMVSTDDDEIAEIALEYGAVVPFTRSKENSDDFSTTTDVLVEVIERYRQQGCEFESGCCIYPTAPFVTPDKLKQAFDILKAKKAFSVFPVAAFSFPIWRSLKIVDKKVQFNWPKYSLTRSQDLSPAYHDSGQFYFFDISAFLKERKLIAANTYPLIVPEREVQDIDNETDWELAELKYKIQLKQI